METGLKQLLNEQRRLIDHYFETLDMKEVECFFQMVLKCTGTLLFSGVGKSGFVAQKIVATLVSTGAKARFLPPMDALHGDMGLVEKGDLFVGISKSGESEELIALLPFLEQRGVQTAALVSRPDSRLESKVGMTVHLPVLRELCPHDLAPTTSAVVQLLFGDAIAVAWMREKRVDIATFAANHPGGLLGRKITLKVADLMLKGSALPLCKKTDRLMNVLHVLSEKQSGCLIIVDEKNAFEGIFTDGDLRRAIEKDGSKALEKCLEELMTRSARAISSDALAMEAMETMERDPKKPVTVLPVIEEGKVIGLVRMHDILQERLR